MFLWASVGAGVTSMPLAESGWWAASPCGVLCSSRLNVSATPASIPSIVWLFPDPVCPYMNSVPIPLKELPGALASSAATARTSGAAQRPNTSAFCALSSKASLAGNQHALWYMRWAANRDKKGAE